MKTNILFNKHLIAATLIGLSTLLTPSAWAQEDLHFTVNAGFSTGGDKLVETTQADLNAGGGFFGEVGIVYTLPALPISIQATIGLMFDSVDYVGGKSSIDSNLLNLILFYQVADQHRIGAGMTQHMSTKYKFEYAGISETTEFDSATGLVLEYDYFFSSSSYFGFRFVNLEYNTKQLYGKNLDAGGLQILVGANF